MDHWWEISEKLLKKMFTICKKGLAANFLSNLSVKQDDIDSYFADPRLILSFSQSRLSNKVVLRHDYKPNDFTMYIYK